MTRRREFGETQPRTERIDHIQGGPACLSPQSALSGSESGVANAILGELGRQRLCQSLLGLGHGWGSHGQRLAFPSHARHRPPRQAAWHDGAEVREVGIHIERQAVHGDIPGESNSQRADLAAGASPLRPNPDPGRGGISLPLQTSIGERVNHRLLQKPHESVHANTKSIDVNDDIRHQLPGAVVGDIAAAVGLSQLDAAGCKLLF